jgi:hypothetical protein
MSWRFAHNHDINPSSLAHPSISVLNNNNNKLSLTCYMQLEMGGKKTQHGADHQ